MANTDVGVCPCFACRLSQLERQMAALLKKSIRAAKQAC